MIHARVNESRFPGPLVSVIMNGHNAARYLREALDSVLAQTYSDWEIILWDNQSTDETAEIVASYQDHRIRYFLARTFTPLGEARNLALAQAKGQLIAFLDCDDLWLPTKLEKQIPLFDRDPSVGLVICDTFFFNDRGLEKRLYGKRKPPQGNVFRELLSNYFISLETAIIRRAALDKLTTWFDNGFNAIEEYDLFVRIGYDWKLAYVDEVLAKWRVHEASWTWSRSELFPAETRLFLESLAGTIPNFRERYAEEIRSVMRKIAWQEAQLAWRKGAGTSARALLAPYRKDNPLYLALFLSTYLPYSWFAIASRLSGRVAP